VKKWEPFTNDNIWVKRPGTWEIKAEKFENILWKHANKDLNSWEYSKHLHFHLIPIYKWESIKKVNDLNMDG
jgi:sialic acid synthase SpsE